MKKIAVGNTGSEELAQLGVRVETRENIRATIEHLFEHAVKTRSRDRKFMEMLFCMTPASQGMSYNLSKTAHVDTFFLQGGHLTEAQRRYPELLKVAQVNNRPAPDLTKKPSATATTGALPSRSALSGGSA
jgi:hypothetical protein